MRGEINMRAEIFLIILGMAAVTYITRIGSLVVFHYTGIPDWLEGWMKHVPTSIFTALIVPALLFPKGYLDITIHNHYLIAGIIAAVVAYKSHNIIMTIGLGMLIMLSFRWLGM